MGAVLSMKKNEQQQDLFDCLSDDLLDECFSFLGKGHFLYVGTTSKRFKNVYYKEGVRNKETFYENAAWSVSCAKMCLKESITKQQTFVRIAKMAGKQGRVKVVKWIHGHEELSCSSLCFLNPAAHSGQLKVLEWAEKNGAMEGFRISAKACSFIRDDVAMAAAQSGQVKVLDFMHTNDLEIPSRLVCDDACIFGRVAVLDWMKERDLLDESESAYSLAAARVGRINVLDWLYDNGFAIGLEYVVIFGFHLGRLQLLLWAWRHGANLQENHCAYFVEPLDDDDFDLLQSLLEVEECPWGRAVIQNAQAKGNRSIVNWAVEHGWVDENGAFLAH